MKATATLVPPFILSGWLLVSLFSWVVFGAGLLLHLRAGLPAITLAAIAAVGYLIKERGPGSKGVRFYMLGLGVAMAGWPLALHLVYQLVYQAYKNKPSSRTSLLIERVVTLSECLCAAIFGLMASDILWVRVLFAFVVAFSPLAFQYEVFEPPRSALLSNQDTATLCEYLASGTSEGTGPRDN